MDLLFLEVAIVISIAGVIALFAFKFRQPLIIAYIVTGLIVGPGLFNLTRSPEVFTALSQIGIAFLLFLVGINLNWRSIKDVGVAASLAGFGQVFFTTSIGFGIGLLLGFDIVPSLFLAVAFAFSSTIVIVKLLSDKNDLDRFYGRISVGVLIIQDLIAMLILLVVGAFYGNGDEVIYTVIALALIKAVLAIVCLWFLAKYVLPVVFKYAAQSQELLFLTAVIWCFIVASSLQFLGFGIEIGALFAGISLAGSKFHREIESKIRPLRDFFLIIFFIVLGTHLSFDALAQTWQPALIFSSFILIGNPLIVIFLMRLFGYHTRIGFLVGVTMAQISEFSFILLSVALTAGIIDSTIMTLATLVGLGTIAISTYLIKYSEIIYQKIEWVFKFLEKDPDKEVVKHVKAPEILILGYEHLTRAFFSTVKAMKKDYLVVDFNPAVVEELKCSNVPHIYGDAGNEDFLRDICASKAKLVISTIPDMTISKDLIAYFKSKRARSTLIVTAKTPEEAKVLYEFGATFVILPNAFGGTLFADFLKKRKMKKVAWKSAAKSQVKKMQKN